MDADQIAKKATAIRRHVCESTTGAGSGHPGGSLSAADILAVLYFHTLKHRPKEPGWPERDRLVLSKGHAAPALYAALAEAGYFPVSDLKGLRKLGHHLQGHPAMDTPGVEACTGSLGQGLSVAVGMALAAKLDKRGNRIYCVAGDGECQEGQIWEAAMAASHYALDNITLVVDRNGLQIDGFTKDVMSIEPLAAKWRAFGWHVIKINGHSIPEIMGALAHREKGKPIAIIANTVKGSGVSFMENVAGFHGKPASQQQLEQALEELQ
ncbi:MAG: transketolase [Candidatus Eisenbacteria sp.]|nr:transketolase [Candidatus Eisenbacteria bacterium]